MCSLIRTACAWFSLCFLALVLVGQLAIMFDDTAAKKYGYQTDPIGFVNKTIKTYHNWTLHNPDKFTIPSGGYKTMDPNGIDILAWDMARLMPWIYPNATIALKSKGWPLDTMYEVLLKGTLALTEGPKREQAWIQYDPSFGVNVEILSRLTEIILCLHPGNRRHDWISPPKLWKVGGMKEWSIILTRNETFVQKNRCVLEWLQNLTYDDDDLATNLDFISALHHNIPTRLLQIESPC